MVTEREAGAAPSSRPGLYLHLPFCSEICPYCDFSVLKGGREQQRSFVADLRREIRLLADEPWPGERTPPEHPFDTIYLGGGTPSLLDPEDLELLLIELERLGVDPEAWIFLEANPEDVTRQRVAAWRRLKIRTLSIGVQSFDSRNLHFLGRRHSPRDARRAVELAGQAGFHTVSLDMIYGLPHQTPADWQQDLEAARRLAPDHLSCYELTIHDRTPFGFRRQRGELVEPPEEAQAELFRLTHEVLNEAGYLGYEVSSFATGPQHESRHNWKYWRHVPYLGLGPSAHSFGGAHRWWNVRKLGPYQAMVASGQRPIEDGEELTSEQLLMERLILGLRTYEGVDLGLLADPPASERKEENLHRVEKFCREGLLIADNGRLRPTLAGLAVADGLAAAFSPSPA